MKLVFWKNYLGDQILYRSLDPSKKTASKDYKDLPENCKNGKHIGCAIALMTKNAIKPLQNGVTAARVDPGNKAMNTIKPHTPAGKVRKS